MNEFCPGVFLIVSPDVSEAHLEAVELSVFVAARSVEVKRWKDELNTKNDFIHVLANLGWTQRSEISNEVRFKHTPTAFLPKAIIGLNAAEAVISASPLFDRGLECVKVISAVSTDNSVQLMAKLMRRVSRKNNGDVVEIAYRVTHWVGELSDNVFSQTRLQLKNKLNSLFEAELSSRESAGHR